MITNLVVALMITGTNLVPVSASEVRFEPMYPAFADTQYRQAYGPIETLYRTEVVTNFVFSAPIHPIPRNLTGKAVVYTRRLTPVNREYYFTPEELFGKPVTKILFDLDGDVNRPPIAIKRIGSKSK